jgi:hypothetical protein
MGYELKTNQTADTTQKSRTHVIKILNSTNTIFGEKCEFSWVQVSL